MRGLVLAATAAVGMAGASEARTIEMTYFSGPLSLKTYQDDDMCQDENGNPSEAAACARPDLLPHAISYSVVFRVDTDLVPPRPAPPSSPDDYDLAFWAFDNGMRSFVTSPAAVQIKLDDPFVDATRWVSVYAYGLWLDDNYHPTDFNLMPEMSISYWLPDDVRFSAGIEGTSTPMADWARLKGTVGNESGYWSFIAIYDGADGYWQIDDPIATVPIPAAGLLAAAGLSALGLLRVRRR